MISNNEGNEEVGLRLLVHAELSEKFNDRINKAEKDVDEANAKIATQASQIKELEQKLANDKSVQQEERIKKLEKQLAKEKENNLNVGRKLVLAEGSLESLTIKFNKQSEELSESKSDLSELKQYNPVKLKDNLQKSKKEASELKKEVTELKKLNPLRLKDNLHKKKKELEKLNSANAELKAKVQENKKDAIAYNKTIKYLKEELEQVKKQPENVEDYYLHTSNCGNFKVFPVSFESADRPYIGDGINYRVIDIRDGTSYIAHMQDDEIVIGTPAEVPKDVLKYIYALATFSGDVEEMLQKAETSE